MKEKKAMNILKKITCVAIVLIAIINFITNHNVIIEGESMMPTYYDKELLHGYFYNKKDVIEKERVVVAKVDAVSDLVIKRVVAGPGDTVSFDGKSLFVNGEIYVDEFSPCGDLSNSQCPLKKINDVVLQDAYFLLGDNRENSCDSRSFGIVPAKSIISIVK